jgi:hypothetical protein
MNVIMTLPTVIVLPPALITSRRIVMSLPGANQAGQHPLCGAESKHQRFRGARLIDKQL